MASAGILSNRNEPSWPESRVGLMGKVPYTTNPNPKKQFQFLGDYNNGCQNDESPVMTQTISDNASSINRRSNNDFNMGNAQYLSFNVSSCSRKELAELKNKLMSELERIRQLKNRIESGELYSGPNYNTSTKKPISSKKLSGTKRPIPVNSNHCKDSNPKRLYLDNVDLMKSCGQILSKLMKHKHAWIFNKPVDVVALKLHDYGAVIKHPMDLGTVKSNLAKNIYSSPLEFATHVRLTFNNAMTYNPKGHDVYVMADQLLARFEELYHPLNERLGGGLREEHGYNEDLQASSWDQVELERPERLPRKRDEPPPPGRIDKKLEQVRGGPVGSSNPPPLIQSPVRTPSPMRAPPVKPVKQPKPKAKDPNKRDMSMEEKHKLGIGLQSLPPEKMEQVVQIIRKRNGDLKQDGDEIELDIEAVDTETLWELDRLVTNWKKLVSKINRQALMVNNNNIASNKGDKELQVSEKLDVPLEPKRPKKGEAGDEDVDIGDDMPMSSFPPVEIEKDEGGGHASSSSSSSSSSGSDSSSSSDSDSGSSSGSDSDDNAQS